MLKINQKFVVGNDIFCLFAKLKINKMTRINSNLSTIRIVDEMQIAEHREIKRLPKEFAKRFLSGKDFLDIPENFCLGTGHVKFFLDKANFTLQRYLQIHAECLKRGFNVQDYSSNWKIYDAFSDVKEYVATENDVILIKNRITENILKSPKACFHYYGEKISKEKSIKLLYE